MNINATLFIQAINFFIAYVLFRVILLRPAYDAIEHQRSYYASLQDQVLEGQEQLAQKQERQRSYWVQLHTFYEKNKPVIPDKTILFEGIAPVVRVKMFSEKEFIKSQDDVARLIVDRLKSEMS